MVQSKILRNLTLVATAASIVFIFHLVYNKKITQNQSSYLREMTNNVNRIKDKLDQTLGEDKNNFHALKRKTIQSILQDYKQESLNKMEALIRRNATSRDPDVISLARELMDPPTDHMVKVVRPILATPQSKEVVGFFNGKKNGFFIECGALDGERSSNTMDLERNYGWTGLLIEMDPYYYTQLRGKSRRSWSINACVSPYDFPTMLNFKEHSGGRGTLKENKELDASAVPCFPMESMLLALNTTHVDYWSLDVEGFELEILKTIPFDRLDITMLSVEYIHGKNGKEAYRKFMEDKNYRVHKDIATSDAKLSLFVDDFIFVKN